MRKEEADRIIEQYIKPIYGFAMNKTRNIGEAEELSSKIILQVYDVLIKKESFIDLNSYIFKIAHNVWTRYIDERVKLSNNLHIEEVNVLCEGDIAKDIIKGEMAGKLRLEIAFLSKQQREIVILHYYNGLKLKEIAEKLDLSEGTVKWHLYESKKEMKKGMEVMRTVGNLGVNPIKFNNMGHDGQPGKKGDTEDFLRKIITQNIAYAAYHEPVTINKIAEELGISPMFVEDEVNELEEYGFMDKLPGGRYQTNMLIYEPSEEKWESLYEIYKKYADILVEEYFLQFFNMEEQFKSLNIYYPKDDFNLLLWSVIPYAMKKLQFPELEKVKYDEVTVIRKDGGNYIANVIIQKEINKSDDFRYEDCVDMFRSSEELEVYGWQLNTAWCNREIGWRDNLATDYISLYHFINGKLEENNVNLDVYRRLIDKGYLIKIENGYDVNVVYCKNKEITYKFKEIFPVPSEKLKNIGKKLDKDVYEIEKRGQPFHIHKIIAYRSQNRLAALQTYVLKNLVDRGLLKEPNPEEAKGISTILFKE